MNTIRKDTGMIGNLQRFIAIVLLTVIAATYGVPVAHAGFWSWLGGRDAEASLSATASDAYLANAPATPLVEPQSAISGHTLMPTAPAPVTSANKVVRYQVTVQVSGYNSEVGQTDASPFIMANGNHVRWGAVAANIIDANGRNIPFGTVIKIPSLYGDQLFVVEDRLNKRYTRNVDIWFANKADALKLGRRTVVVEVIR